MVQIDAYSARLGLAGMKREELPRLGAVMREGWYFIPVFVALVVFMLQEQQEALAPFYATAILLAINQALPQHRMGWSGFVEFVAAAGRALAELAALLLGVGFLIGALLMTGLAGTLANDLVYLAGGAPLVLLVMGAITSFIFGLGLTVTACYIFLAIVLAPPLIKAGLDPLAIHMFVLYWGMVSFITPPVALAAFAAAPIAQDQPDEDRHPGDAARHRDLCRAVLLCAQSGLAAEGRRRRRSPRALYSLSSGIGLAAAALQGYVAGLGRIPSNAAGGLVRARCCSPARSISAIPVERFVGLPMPQAIALGLALAAAGLGLLYWINNNSGRTAMTTPHSAAPLAVVAMLRRRIRSPCPAEHQAARDADLDRL